MTAKTAEVLAVGVAVNAGAPTRFGYTPRRQTTMRPELQAEWDALSTAYIELQQAHKDLQESPYDRNAHVIHGQRLRAHMARLQDFATRLEQEHHNRKA